MSYGNNNYSMSNNAISAYNSGEKPLSKWTKADIVNAFPEDKQRFVESLTLKELRDNFLAYGGWHHTGKYYNRTEFWYIDEDAIEEITQEKVEQIKSKREKVEKEKVKEKPTYITAKIKYTVWVGKYRNYQKPKEYIEIVRYMSDDKIIKTENGNKRLSSVDIIFSLEQKTKYATDRQLTLKELQKRKERLMKNTGRTVEELNHIRTTNTKEKKQTHTNER